MIPTTWLASIAVKYVKLIIATSVYSQCMDTARVIKHGMVMCSFCNCILISADGRLQAGYP